MEVKKPTPVDLTTIDTKRLKDLSTDLPGLIEYAHNVGGFSIVPTKQGVIRGNALKAMKQQTQMQLDMLLEQMKLLASQAQSIKDRAQVSEMIYDAHLKFSPVIGGRYYLYEKEGEKMVLSMVSPQEWGDEDRIGLFVAEVELLADHTWKIIRQQ
ncbi:MAG: DUF2452 domain-containing protein [Bacteriovoracaceae bacterium]|nr:DUF2452 domain-containing protein [Bacteriovoracaceae bacterium]